MITISMTGKKKAKSNMYTASIPKSVSRYFILHDLRVDLDRGMLSVSVCWRGGSRVQAFLIAFWTCVTLCEITDYLQSIHYFYEDLQTY